MSDVDDFDTDPPQLRRRGAAPPDDDPVRVASPRVATTTATVIYALCLIVFAGLALAFAVAFFVKDSCDA